MGHLDTTRYGAIFHPALAPHLAKVLQIPAISGAILAAGPLVRRLPGGRVLRAAALAGMTISLAALAERELRGTDVPGASDNASGTAVAMQLAAECAAAPLDQTEVDLLITSCEESGMLGAQAYARAHKDAGRSDDVPQLRHGRRARAAHLHRARGQCHAEPARVTTPH